MIESKAIGADMILLIAEVLDQKQVAELSSLARSIGLEVLLEMHSEDQLDKMCEWVSVVGVNNRNLKDFSVDFDRSKRLFDRLPREVPKIAESGLGSAQTLYELFLHGFRGFLIGETFMKTENPGATCAKMIGEFNRLKEL